MQKLGAKGECGGGVHTHTHTHTQGGLGVCVSGMGGRCVVRWVRRWNGVEAQGRGSGRDQGA